MHYFTSDLHIKHKNILRFTDRPCRNLDHMEEMIIEDWNKDIKKGDVVYHLGDLCFGKPVDAVSFISKLNGEIHLLKGNHCNKVMQNELRKLPNVYAYDSPYHEIKFMKKKIVLCHYPIYCWNGERYGAYMLHGHCHNSFNGHGKMMDVGLDACWENYKLFRPISFDEVHEILKERPIDPRDYHKPSKEG